MVQQCSSSPPSKLQALLEDQKAIHSYRKSALKEGLEKRDNTHEQHGLQQAQLQKTLPEMSDTQQRAHQQMFTGNQKIPHRIKVLEK